MNINFSTCLKLVLQSEGGFTNSAHDPGRATNFGVTQAVYDAWRHKNGKPQQSVRFIGQDEIEAIYKTQYWDAVRGDEVPSGVDYCLFDEGVNSGPIKSIKDLQTALKVPSDGQFGLMTMGTLLKSDPHSVIQQMCALRLNFLRRLTTWRFFGAGWKARVLRVQAASLNMIVNTPQGS